MVFVVSSPVNRLRGAMSIFTRMFRRGPRDPDEGPSEGSDAGDVVDTDAAIAARVRARAAAAAAAAARAEDLEDEQEPDTDPGLGSVIPGMIEIGEPEPPESPRPTDRIERLDRHEPFDHAAPAAK